MKRIFSFLLAVIGVAYSVAASAYWEPHWISRFATIGFHTNTLGQNKVLILGDSNSEAFYWNATGVFDKNNTATCSIVSGVKALSATLDRLRITTVNGTDTFDAGAVNILYG